MFNWRQFDDAVHPSHTGAANAAVELLAAIVHNTLKSSLERRKRKNEVIYAEVRDFVIKRLPENVQAEIQSSSSDQLLSATLWQKQFVPTIITLMPGFFFGTVRAQWGIEKVLFCFPDH